MSSILKKYRVTLQAKFIAFTGSTLFVLFFILSITIYQTQKKNILASNEDRMYGHLRDLVNTVNIYYEEQISDIKSFGMGFDKLIVEKDYGIQETDSLITMSVISFNHEDPKNHNKRLDIKVNQWLHMGRQLQNGDHVFVDAQSETFGGLISIFQHTTYGELVIQSNLKFDGKTRSENVLVKDAPLDKALAGEEHIMRIKVIDDWVQAFYKPIYLNGEIKGVLFIGHYENIIERVDNILNEITYFKTGYPYFFNSNNEFTIHPYLKGQKTPHVTNIDSLKAQGTGKMRYNFEQNGSKRWKWMFYHYYEPYDMFIAVSVDEEEYMDKPLRETGNIVFIGFFIALSLGMICIFLLVKSITRPINQLSEKLQDLAKGKSVIAEFEERNDEIGDISKAVDKVVGSVNAASAFANEIGNENYDAHFEPLGEEDLLGNSLLNMKKSLKEAQKEREKRNWINQGMARFANSIRENAHDIQAFSDQVLKHLLEVLNANQGMLYVLKQDDDAQIEKMVLTACYAWDRKKYNQSEIIKGEGLVGQAWLEKDIIRLEAVPDNYINISSGLGQAKPNMVLIVPLKLEHTVQGVLEIASFNRLQDFEIEFVSKIAESIASTLSSARVNEKTQYLLEKTQVMTETLQSQEEEMRQNMEELQATHEQMSRNEEALKEEIQTLRQENQSLSARIQDEGNALE